MLRAHRRFIGPNTHQPGKRNGLRVGAGVVLSGVGPLVGTLSGGQVSRRSSLLAPRITMAWLTPPTGAHKGPHSTSTPLPPLRVTPFLSHFLLQFSLG